jgi:Fe-S cluster biosynthesis and repair protein YggX/DNA-binding SARP family transcriptional activator
MSESNPRVEQFKKMAEADPTNELGHFSLGKAYLEAGQTTPAIGAFQRVIDLNPNISKVYQLLASALVKENRKDEAILQLNKGIEIAVKRGDLMPKNEMIAMLKELGAPVPESATSAPEQPVGEGEVLCNRCGKVKRKMASPPFSNAQGKLIYEKICADCWREWIGMGTKVINELRLPLSDPQAQKIFDQHMKEFLNL